MKTNLAFCESVTASPFSPWCIREVTSHGKKFSGGVDTSSFCGRVKVPLGWDLDVEVTSERLESSHICKNCLQILKLRKDIIS
jgi:hypothetical protein